MTPMTVKIFDVTGVIHKFLDMFTITGRAAATAETMLAKCIWLYQRMRYHGKIVFYYQLIILL